MLAVIGIGGGQGIVPSRTTPADLQPTERLTMTYPLPPESTPSRISSERDELQRRFLEDLEYVRLEHLTLLCDAAAYFRALSVQPPRLRLLHAPALDGASRQSRKAPRTEPPSGAFFPHS